MILMGKLPDEPGRVSVTLTVDASNFTRYVVETARRMAILDVSLEVFGLTVDQTWALFYQRGAFDPEFAEPDAFDNHLRVLGRLRGKRGHAARAGFLHGWAQHRTQASAA